MSSRPTRVSRRGALARASVWLSMSCTPSWLRAAAVVDPMDRPSTPSARARTALLTAVARAGRRLVAVGERGTVLGSDDDGETWTQVGSPVSVMLTGVRFATEQIGWAVGHSGVILKTSDAGLTWVKQMDGVMAAKLLLDDARSRAAAAPQVDMTREIAEWERWVRDGADKPLLALLTRSRDECIVVGAYGLALRTTDGGQTWRAWTSHLPNEKGSHLYGIAANGNVIYLAGEMGLVLRSDDGGSTFVSQKTPYSGSYFGVAVQNASEALLIGLRGRAMVTSDGGAVWAPVDVGTDASLSHAELLPNGSIAVGSFAGNLILRRPGTGRFVPIPLDQAEPIVGIAATAGGGLVLVGVRGVRRITDKALGGGGSHES